MHHFRFPYLRLLTLLQAERKAHEIVQAARTYRTQRLKAAKTDASSEIDAYKKEKEVEFKDYEAKVC